jgi:DNA-binding IclR family transcriptional regulator
MKSALHTINLLRQFAVQPDLGVTELSRRTGLDPASVHRLLQVLLKEGIVAKNDRTKKYRLDVGVLDIAAGFLGQQGLVTTAGTYLDELTQRTGETTALFIRDRNEAISVACVESRQMVHVKSRVGERIPLYCTSVGFVLMADMSKADRDKLLRPPLAKRTPRTIVDTKRILTLVRQAAASGIGYSDEFLEMGVRSVASPVRGTEGRVLGALALIAPTQRLTNKLVDEYGRVTRQIGESFTREIVSRRIQ